MGKSISIEEASRLITEEMNYAKKWIANRTAMKMRNKLIDVYDAIIDEFYSEPAKYYNRHDVGWGEQHKGVGVNLYRAIQQSKNKTPKLMPYPHTISGGISLNASDMADYNYQYHTKEEVLDYILDGIRFPSLEETGGNKSLLKFVSHYNDGECSASGTPLEVLASVRDQLANKYAEQAKAEARKELKLKYIKIS